MKVIRDAIKAGLQNLPVRYQQLTHQHRLIAIVMVSILACSLLLLCFRHATAPMYSMEPHSTVYVKGPIEDKASLDTPEETLNRVAIEYNKVVTRVDMMAREQQAYQAKLEKTLQALQAEVNTLKTALKIVKAQQTVLKAAQDQAPASNEASKPMPEPLVKKAPLVDAKPATAAYPPSFLSAAKATLVADAKPLATSPAEMPITFVNDLSLPAGQQKPMPPALPPASLSKSPLPNKPPVKTKRSTETLQNDWPNVGDTTHKRAQARNQLQQAFDQLSGDTDNKTTSTAHIKKEPPDEVVPYYTLPANATGLQATLMTALVGRIPVHGHVQDPYPFKIILGQENLAANGLTVPAVSGMVVAGFAVGDMTLRSVKGWITSVTFVFPDGRIHTVQSNAQGGSLPTQAGSLGYLSDPYGNPFLSGKLITNAPREIATQIALGSAQGLAGAFAHPLLPVNLPPGSKAALLMPAPKHKHKHFSRWLLGNSTTEATTRLNTWWQAHHSGSFDAIYVPAGKPVVINFTREISIDYHKQGRKLNYEKTNTVLPTVSTLSLSPDAGGLD